MNKIIQAVKKANKLHLFLFIVGINLVASVIYLLCTRGAILDHYVVLSGRDRFMDFFNHIRYVEDPKNTYYVIKDACFPPLAYIFYLFLNRLLPTSQATGTHWGTDANGVPFDVVQPYALLVYVVYVAVFTLLLYHVIIKLCKSMTQSQSLIFALSVIASNIFVFWIFERGNSAFIVAILLMAFYLWKDSPSKVKRELAMILLAVAAGFKVYPAIFGIVYIAEKRYKEAIRLIIYGALIFFLPFAFFGGFDAIIQFVKNQGMVHSNMWGSMHSLHAACLLYIKDEGIANTVSAILRVGVALLAFCVVLWSREEDYKKYYLLCAMMIILPAWNGGYTRAYLLLPLILLLNKEIRSKAEWIYTAMFAVMFSFIAYNAFISGQIFGEYVIYSMIYILTAIFLVQGVIDIIKRIAKKISNKNTDLQKA